MSEGSAPTCGRSRADAPTRLPGGAGVDGQADAVLDARNKVHRVCDRLGGAGSGARRELPISGAFGPVACRRAAQPQRLRSGPSEVEKKNMGRQCVLSD